MPYRTGRISLPVRGSSVGTSSLIHPSRLCRNLAKTLRAQPGISSVMHLLATEPDDERPDPGCEDVTAGEGEVDAVRETHLLSVHELFVPPAGTGHRIEVEERDTRCRSGDLANDVVVIGQAGPGVLGPRLSVGLLAGVVARGRQEDDGRPA